MTSSGMPSAKAMTGAAAAIRPLSQFGMRRVKKAPMPAIIMSSGKNPRTNVLAIGCRPSRAFSRETGTAPVKVPLRRERKTAGPISRRSRASLDSWLFQLAGDTPEERAETGLDCRHGDGKCETGCGSDQAVLDRRHAVLVLEEVNNPAHAKLLR